MMKSKTIVLWGREDLLSSSVELFLTAQKGWRVVSISDEENFEALLMAVAKVHPDVVIIQQGDRSSNSYPLMKLIQDHPGLKVITVSLKDNLMEVYSKQDIFVKSASDLISVVEAAPVNASQQ
jgi:DNA-binding NarL/FixJ family response regulator